MTRTLLAAVALTVLAVAPAPAASLRTNIVVEGSTIRLDDIFDDAGPRGDAQILYSPAPGHHIVLNAAWLAQVARMFQVAWRPSSQYDRAVIERAGRTITTAEFLPPLRRELRAAGMADHADIEFSRGNIDISLALQVQPTIDVRNVTYDRPTGQFTALIIAGGDNPGAQRVTVMGRTYPTSGVPVLRRQVNAGEVIRPDDIETAYRRDDLIGRDVVTEAKQLVGRTPMYRIRPGDPIRQADTRAPLLVTRGGQIVIKLESGSMTITVQGKAVDDGARGDVIRVENLQSHKTIEATVTGPDLVSITLGPRLAASR